MNSQSLLRYALVVLAVVIVGALAGWYFFLKSQTGTTNTLGAARGFNAQTPVGTFPGNPKFSGAEAGGRSEGVPASSSAPPQLWHIANTPVGGLGFATSTEGVRLLYAERASGYLFSADPANGGIARLTKSLMPKIYEALFASSGRVIERSLDDTGAITTYAGHIDAATSSSLTGVLLPNNIVALAADPKTARLVFLRKQNGGVVGVVSRWDGSDQKQVFISALPDWRVWWLSDGRTVLAQKAADSLAGYAYVLKNGAVEPLLGPLPGLTVLPRANSPALLYGASSGGLSLFVRISATTTATRFSIATVADKCVWAPGSSLVAYCAVPQTATGAGFLDSWYRGEAHTSDALWRIDAGAGQAQLVFAPTSDISLDVVNPVMDDGGAYLAFMNAVDDSPWLLRLSK